MKLTPLDIQQQRFPRGFGGYKAKEVETFLEFISREYQHLLGDLDDSVGRVRKLEEELFRYREREDTLKEALVTAQRIAEDTRAAAKKEADLVIADAEMKAERIIHHAHSRLIAILEEISDLKRQRVRLAESLRQVLSTHHKLLDLDEKETQDKDDTVTYLTKLRPSAPEMPPTLEVAANSKREKA